jgi:hypothetical protein
MITIPITIRVTITTIVIIPTGITGLASAGFNSSSVNIFYEKNSMLYIPACHYVYCRLRQAGKPD